MNLYTKLLASAGVLMLVVCGAAEETELLQPSAADELLPPQAVLQYHNDLGGGDLLIDFCLIGSHVCVERKAKAYGRVCNSSLAREIGTGESGDYAGFILPIYHYAGFRCGYGHRFHPKTDRVSGGGNFMD